MADGRLFPEHKEAQEKEAHSHDRTLDAYANVWLESCRRKNLKSTTMLRYVGILNTHLRPALGHLLLSAIDRARVREMVLNPGVAGLAPKTLHNILRTLSAIFSQAIEDGLVAHNPALKPSKLVKIRKVGEHVEVFSHEEEVLVLATAKATWPHYYPFILTLFRTGLREGEAIALMPDDLDLRSRYVLVERNFTAGQLEESPKSGKRREVDLARDLVGVLKEHLALQEAEAAMTGKPRQKWLFTSQQGGILRSNNFRDRVWKPLLRHAGIRYRTVHATRHTFATRLIMGSARLVYVQKQLGHSSIQITVDLYTHWIKRSDRARTLEVDNLLTPPNEYDGGTFGGTRPNASLEVAKT